MQCTLLVILSLFASSLVTPFTLYLFLYIFSPWHATEFVNFIISSQYHRSIKFSKQVDSNRFWLKFFPLFLKYFLPFNIIFFNPTEITFCFIKLYIKHFQFNAPSPNYFTKFVLLLLYAIVTQLIITRNVESFEKLFDFQSILCLYRTTKPHKKYIDGVISNVELKIRMKILIWNFVFRNFVLVNSKLDVIILVNSDDTKLNIQNILNHLHMLYAFVFVTVK